MTKEVKTPKRMGPVPKEINWEVVDAILQYGATLVDCAEMAKVSDDTLANRIRDLHGCTFTEYRNRKMSKVRISLARKQYDVAMSGDRTLLIWLGKQWLGQSEKSEVKQVTTNIEEFIKKESEKLKD